MTKREIYEVVIEDALARINILQAECVDLENELERKKAEIAAALETKKGKIVEVENTVEFIKNDLIPEGNMLKEEDEDFTEKEIHKEIDSEKTERKFTNSTTGQKLIMLQDDHQKKGYSPKKQSNISLSDATEIILEAVGHSMHANELLVQLSLVGRFTDKPIYVSTIRKDHKNRFINLGQNVWDLRNRQENLIDTKMTNEQ